MAQTLLLVIPMSSLPTPSASSTDAAALPTPAAADQTRWFREEVHAHDGQLKSWLKGSFPAVRSEVEDIVQESYLRIWKAKASHPIDSAKSFLFQIARRLSLNHIRNQKNRRTDSLGDVAVLGVMDDRPSSADLLSIQEKMDLLTDAVVALPARCREIILLHKIQGLPQKEVADRLGLSVRTVENTCHTGLVKCADYLRKRGCQGFQID